MKHRFMVRAMFVLLTAVSLTLAYFLKSPIGQVLLCGALFVLFWLYVRHLRKTAEIERKHLLESVQRTASATLGHHRHDWMNDLQILYGYIQLRKIDKLADCVERIKGRMAVESKIARLGIPALVFYLQSFREMNGSVQLEVDIEDELQLDSLLTVDEAEELTDAIVETVRIFQFSGRSSWGETLQLKMSIYREGGEVMVRFDQVGTAGNPEALARHIGEGMTGIRVKADRSGAENGSLRLRVPCGKLNEVNACL
ncbi:MULTISPECIES: Spo0B domain-containing protein [Paenibacillus]|uniref:Spo0B domain-containing protein n=1 Tax=Paenibacillus TaxID=44249 RepID=UPI00073F3D0D|nr:MULTISPECIES: Spo0B domain-containing protein [Paenibacillus]MDU4698138.1 Spo0B domain-containing protein [Paenibacillus sp.]